MEKHFKFATSVIAAVFVAILPACSTQQARQAIETRQREFALNTEAWLAARERLKGMCPALPKSKEEYQRGKQLRIVSGIDPFNGCDIRIIKLSNGPVFDDWHWDWLPSYQRIVAVHDEELRKRVAPKIYEEYALGLARYLAAKADAGQITPMQLAAAFNEAWKWMFGQVQAESILLQQNLQAAQESDAAVWNTLSTVASGLATVATTALITSATAAAYRPAPVHCLANRVGSFVHVNCQ